MSDHEVVESTFELSAFMKAGAMADSERDSGSSSVADEDSRSCLHSPTVSEDSVEVQVIPISLRNKRKLAEPRKIQEPAVIAAPLKKRRFDPISEETTITTVDQEESRSVSTPSPFRPWIPVSCKNESKTMSVVATPSTTTISTTVSSSMSPTTTVSPVTRSKKTTETTEEERRGQEETMQRLHESIKRVQECASSHNRSAVLSRRESRHRPFEAVATSTTTTTPPTTISPMNGLPSPRLQDEPLSLVVRDEAPRVPSHPAVSGTYEKTPSYMMDHLLASSPVRDHSSHHQVHQAHQISSTSSRHHHQGGQQRNYKNMTRERRIEANARERTRVHTISAAFDTLRRAIPAYSHNQKLSKLSVLRIACSYIMTLSHILEKEDVAVTATRKNDLTELGGCVDLVSKTIQTEGKLRKRKDE